MANADLIARIKSGESSRYLDALIECALSDDEIVPDGMDGGVMGDGFLRFDARPYTTCNDDFRHLAVNRLTKTAQ